MAQHGFFLKCWKTHNFNEHLTGKENRKTTVLKIIAFISVCVWKLFTSPPQILLFCHSLQSTKMFCNHRAQSHPSYFRSSLCVHPLRTRSDTCTAIPPHAETLAQATEIAVDCERKDNSLCCCVGVTQLCFIIPTLCDSQGKRDWEKSL